MYRYMYRYRYRYICTTHYIFFIHSSIDGHLGCFHTLGIVNNAAINVRVHVSFQISVSVFFGYRSSSGITGSQGNSTSNFLRNLHTVSHSGCTNSHSHQQCTSIPISLHPHQHLSFLGFLMVTISTGVR